MTDRDWLYLRVEVASLDDVHDLLVRVVRPALAQCRQQDPSLAWFYLQYADHTGLQLRLRLNAGRALLSQWHADLLRRFRTDPAAGAVSVRLYEPELAKYGGAPGVELAEQLFGLGSDVALALRHDRQRRLRLGYGAVHMAAVCDELSDPPAFLHQYGWYWSGRGTRALPWQQQLGTLRPGTPATRAKVAELRRACAQVREHPDGRALSDYARRFWDRIAAHPARRRPEVEAGAHLHLMNNRLGLVPAEEAVLARLLWLERTASSGELLPT